MLSAFLAVITALSLMVSVALVLRAVKSGQSLESWVIVSFLFYASIALTGLLACHGFELELIRFDR